MRPWWLSVASFCLLFCLASAPLPVGSSDAAIPIQIEEWEVPFGGHPRDPFAAGADAIWFVGQRAHYLGRFTPATGAFFKWDLPDAAGPHNLIVGSDGIVWYAGNRRGHIGRFDQQSGAFEKIAMPDAAARDPHTLVFSKDERYVWFTVQNGNFVGRLTLADRTTDLIAVPTLRARPYGIKMAPDGTPWIVLLGTNKLASVDPQTLALTEYEIPAGGARPRRLEVTSDGRVWYADYGRGYLGMYDPAAGSFKEWAMPSGANSRPYGMASNGESRVWVVETGVFPNMFVEFDTQTERFSSATRIPSGARTVRHMDFHAATQAVWFGTDANTLGRAIVGGE